jgi:thiol-disulfide isomerase/thioredoxin
MKISVRESPQMKIFLTFLFLNLLVEVTAALASGPDRGMWRGEIQLKDESLPFNFEVTDSVGQLILIVRNGAERIRVDEIREEGDSLYIRMPLFDSEFRVRCESDLMTGVFVNHARKENKVFPFTAQAGESFRFESRIPVQVDVSGKWECRFSPGTPDSSSSIALLEQNGGELLGTFLTPSGDYRYLQGNVEGNSFSLSAFDGSHLFLFKGTVDDSGRINGRFYSGNHWREVWTAKRNDQFELPDPYAITFLKPGYDSLAFSFPDLEGDTVSISDQRFRNKVVIVQIMGTWCPNCMDETEYYSALYKSYRGRGLEIIGIAFERFPEFATAQKNLRRLKQRFDVEYPLLFGGQTGEAANRALPMLDGIKAYPTSIFIDRKGKVRAIYTGITGPATGDAFEKWKDDLQARVRKLLDEK